MWAVKRDKTTYLEVNRYFNKLYPFFKFTCKGPGFDASTRQARQCDYLHYPRYGAHSRGNNIFPGYQLVTLQELKLKLMNEKHYRLIKTYPGHKTLGEITKEDMSKETE